MKKIFMRRALTVVLSASLAISLFGVPVCAEPQGGEGLLTGMDGTGICAHHTKHTQECGYAQESPCGHVHTDECYVEMTECLHIHTEECYPEEEAGMDASDGSAANEGIETHTGNAAEEEEVSGNRDSEESGEDTENQDSGEVGENTGNQDSGEAGENTGNQDSDTNEDTGDLDTDSDGGNTEDGGTSSDTGTREPVNCTHVCSPESGCITRELACRHIHDASCGYAKARPCTYQCLICNGQADGDAGTEPGIDKTEPDLTDKGATEGAGDENLCPHHTVHTPECGYIEGENSVCSYECAVCALQEMIDALPDAAEINGENAMDAAGLLAAIDSFKEAMTDEELAGVDFARYLALAAALEGQAGEPGLTAEGGTVRTEQLDLSDMTGIQENAAEGWKWDADNKTLTLNNCHIKTESSKSMIVVPENCAVTIVMEGENVLESESMSFAAMINNKRLVSNNDWIFEGSGSLEFLAKGEPSGDYYAYAMPGKSVTVKSGTITSNVCFCMLLDGFTMEGGSLTVTGPMDSSENGIYTDSGPVNISGGKIDITIGQAGIFVPGISGGVRSVNISGGDVAIRTKGAGIHINSGEGDGQEINITGGNLSCEVSGNAALYAKNINISGQASVEAKSENQPGIRARENLEVGGGAQVTASSTNSYGMYVPNGTVSIADSANVTADGMGGSIAASVDKGSGASLNAIIRTDTADERIWTVYGTAALHGDLALGPDALTLDTGEKKAVKMVIMLGAALTIPEGKKLDVSQGLEFADVDNYLSGYKDAIILEGAGDSQGQLILPAQKFTVSVNAEPSQGGTVTGAGIYNKGDAVTVNAQASEGYEFVKWMEADREVGTECSYVFTIEADRELTAVFEAAEEKPPVTETYKIAVKADPPEGGSVKGGGIYQKDSSVTVTARPESGYKFVKWTENGTEISGAGEAYTFKAAADRELTAAFEKDAGSSEEKPDNPGEEEKPDNPGEEEKPDNPGEEEKPDNPGEEEKPDNPGEEEKPDNPGEEEKPDNPGEEEKPDKPGEEEKPDNPGEEEKPDNPGEEEKPGTPGTGETPGSSEKEENSDVSSGSPDDGSPSGTSGADNVPAQRPQSAVKAPESVRVNETGSAVIGTDAALAAVDRAQKEAAQNGKYQDGIAVVIPVEAKQGQTEADIAISARTLDTLMKKNVNRLGITVGPLAGAEFDSGTLKWLRDKSAGENIVLRIRKTGNRPVYEVALICVNDAAERIIGDLEGHSICLSLPYEALEKENAGNLYAVYTDGDGKVTWLTDSVYDQSRGAVLVRAERLGTYGVAYRALNPSFSDIENHWAKSDIAYVVNRGLMQGAGSGRFAPDEALIWENLLAALGRTAGAVPAEGEDEAGFYRAWALEKGILSGSSYASGAAVTRQQLAIALENYMKATGTNLPRVYEAVAFNDLNAVPEQVKTAIRSVQQAGLMNGRDGNCFDPAGTATRAEAASAFRKLIGLRIDVSAFRKWVRNESGHWLYYQSGQRMTGWQNIDGVLYFFNPDGVMHEGEKQEPRTGDWYVYQGAGEMPAVKKKE